MVWLAGTGEEQAVICVRCHLLLVDIALRIVLVDESLILSLLRIHMLGQIAVLTRFSLRYSILNLDCKGHLWVLCSIICTLDRTSDSLHAWLDWWSSILRRLLASHLMCLKLDVVTVLGSLLNHLVELLLRHRNYG